MVNIQHEPIPRVPSAVWKWGRWPLMLAAWALCIWAADDRLHHARHEFSSDRQPDAYKRGDGNSGHTYIDFGGQWVMGRMIVAGHGKHLFDRNYQWQVAREGFTVAAEHPTSQESIRPTTDRILGAADPGPKHDADALVNWMMGKDPPEWLELGKAVAVPLMGGSHGNPFADVALQQVSAERVTEATVQKLSEKARGGALYPPIHGVFFYSWLGLFPPQTAYFHLQSVSIAACFLAGLAAAAMSRGKSWWLLAWPLATAIILLYPGTRPGLDLGQNHLITMAIVMVGWALFVNDREVGAGIVWGLLAFKPVWAISMILVPMLLGRWRFFFAMAAMGLTLILLTLPIVGIEPWIDWFKVGQQASGMYSTDQNWVRLSRDLAGVVRRLCVDVEVAPVPGSDLADLLGWLVPGAILVLTATIYLLKADQSHRVGLAPGFALLAAYLCGFRFMYYDVTVSLLAMAVLFADPRWLLQSSRLAISDPTETVHSPARRRCMVYVNSAPLIFLGLMLLLENWLLATKVQWSVSLNGYARTVANATGGTQSSTPNLMAITDYYYPTDTYILLGLWVWCGWRLWRDGPRAFGA